MYVFVTFSELAVWIGLEALYQMVFGKVITTGKLLSRNEFMGSVLICSAKPLDALLLMNTRGATLMVSGIATPQRPGGILAPDGRPL